MEWSDSQGLSSAGCGAASTVGGVEHNEATWEKIQALPNWLKEAREKALAKEKK
jgi:hypothetical protein